MSEQFRSYLDRTAVELVWPEGATTRTKQSFLADCDINNIMRNWNSKGILPKPNLQPPMYGDFSTGVEYHDAVNGVMAAQANFDGLPADIRARMRHDPGYFMEFLADPANDEEAIELGLKNKPAEGAEGVQPDPTPAPSPVPPPADPPAGGE